MKKIAFIAATVAALAAVPAMAQTNYVTNGGFEQTTRSGNFEFGSSPRAAGQVTGWTSAASGYNILFDSTVATTQSAAGSWSGTGKEMLWKASASSQGGNFVGLDGDAGVRGALSQVITGLTVGNKYTLSFEWGAGQLQSRTGDTTEALQVGFGNDSFTTATLSNPSGGFTGWNTVSRTFTATSTSQVLSFLSIGTPQGLPPIALLDNVKLTNAAVPEPATWAMMIFGFGMVGSSIRYRRRNASVATA